MTQTIDYDLLVDRLVQRASGGNIRTKAVPSSTPTTTYAHGSGGLFSSPAIERPLFSAMLLPRDGLQARLPLKASNADSPLYGIITGVTATTGSEPTGPCDDFPVAGLMKLCSQTAYFARQGRSSRVFEIDRIGRVTDRGENMDYQVFGDPWTGDGNNLVPAFPGISTLSGAMNSEFAKVAFELGAAWARDFAREFYTGNPTNNTASGGRKYYRGLDLQINTGYRDAITGTACTAADSIVASFQGQSVSVNGQALVRTVTDILRRLRHIASGAGLNPVKWVIVMRPSLFYELTEVWPCAYMTYRCQSGSFSTSQVNMIDSEAAINMRDEMRGNMDDYSGQFLWIDGTKVEVVLDDAITEDSINNTPTFQSAMYFVPLTVLGGTPVTWMEYYKYDDANGPMAFAESFGVGSFYKTSDNGRFLWHFKPPTNYCIQLQAKSETRLIMRTPYLAARLTNIRYSPLVHEREPFTDSTYFANGGGTSYSGYGPSYYLPTT
jgi:hypothetical protein